MDESATEPKPLPKRRPRKARGTPLFIGATEMAHHLTVDVQTLNDWIAAGTVPRPHSHPGERTKLWRRDHWESYVRSGVWPAEAWRVHDARVAGSTSSIQR